MFNNDFVPLPQIPAVTPELLRNDPKSGVKLILAEGRHWFLTAHELKCDALEINRGRTRLIDGLIGSLFSIAEMKFASRFSDGRRAAILAQGGYGRREMGLFSDIDLLFLYEGGEDEYIREVTDAILYPLWDNGVDVSGATRTLADCQTVGESDLRTKTAMLDARLVAGDEIEASRFFDFIRRQFADKERLRQFIHAKIAEHENRLKRYGDSVYLLEPNVKEGEGGLRDYHTLLWIAKASFPQEDGAFVLSRTGLSEKGINELMQGVAFLWRIRHALHLLEEKNDRLGFAQQESIAGALGFSEGPLSGVAEQFMQVYYRHASMIHLQCQRAIEQVIDTVLPSSWFVRFLTRSRLADGVYQVGDKLFASAERIAQGASSILNIFAIAHRRNITLDAKTKELIMRHTDAMASDAPQDETTNRLWTKMLSRPVFLNRVLNDMHECRCLTHWFPEMGPLVHQIQHDGYHFYTTDEHVLHAVRELGNLMTKAGHNAFPTPAKALKSVKRIHVLTLSTLLHDVGKGRGKGHAEIGATLGGIIAGRLGFSREDQETVSFLIHSHLLIPTLSYRRDTKDPSLIERLAQTVETPEKLAMLYLLAFADVRSMGPHIWSEWKGGLLAELYLNTLLYMRGGKEISSRQRMISNKLEAVLKLMGDIVTRGELSVFFASMPDRYLMHLTPEAIASHLTMAGKLSGHAIVNDVRQISEKGFSELAVVTRDAPGLFAKIAGALSLNGVNIIDAQLYTLPNGTVLDLLWVTDIAGHPISDEARWRVITRQLEQAIADNLDVHGMIKRQSKKRLLTPKRAPQDTSIEIDNDVAPRETVVDVITHDRQGLLYDISRTFFDLGCTIERAKITTYIDRVIDVFYIRDAKGEKITSRERLRQIREAITKAAS